MNANKLKNMLSNCLIITVLMLLGGCGGSSTPPPTLKLAVEVVGVPSGTLLGTIHGTINVPTGVDIRTSATGQVLDGLIAATGTAATGSPQVMGNFNTTTRQLAIDVVSPAAGFGNGACAAITFDITAGTTVTAADFTVTSAEGKDYTTAAPVQGISIGLK